MEQLFKRDPETLDGVVPKFSRTECMLNLKVESHQVGGEGTFRGFGAFDEDDERYKGPPRYDYTAYITVAGFTMMGSCSINDSDYDKATALANNFLAYKPNKEAHPEAWKYLAENSEELNLSKRYWRAMDHQGHIAKQKAKLVLLQAAVEQSEHFASLYAIEVKAGRVLSHDEKRLIWMELTGESRFPPEPIPMYNP